jgi:hypothetical protein
MSEAKDNFCHFVHTTAEQMDAHLREFEREYTLDQQITILKIEAALTQLARELALEARKRREAAAE